ncbi:hypothetical protein FRC00_009607 [Tulasnella sp. 408]|nr:hypothetical protein FRC00_009607 [Tulasnella sp. 408]
MANLNGNLDVLLIFAALFSAINTAFISMTMPDLSPNPSDETNTLLRLLVMKADNSTLATADLSPPFSPDSTSIIVNCLLYASLSCSLIAAVGAMMAKEWLQSFNRSGQTGPLEEQGKLRQRKFNGVEQWHLEAVIKFLPNLLLLSVVLFFAGIGLFLFPINTVVAGTVIAFSGLGMILSGIAIVAGAISPRCPYQSAASNAVRRISDILSRLWRILSRIITHRLPRLIRRAFKFATQIPQETSSPVASVDDSSLSTLSSSNFRVQPVLTQHLSDTKKNRESKEQILTAQAACWLLQTTSIRADQVAVARFIRVLSKAACALVFEDTRTWRRLLFLTCEALNVFDSQPSEGNRELAEAFGLALCHVPLPLPKDMVKRGEENAFDLMSPQKASSLSEDFLHALDLARAKYGEEDEERVFHLAFMSTLVSRGRMIKEYQWTDLSNLFLVDTNPRPLIADSLPGMWAYAAYRMSDGVLHKISKLEKLMEIGGNIERLTETLSYAIDLSYYGLRSVQGQAHFELNAARAYFVCLRRARELTRNSSSYDLNRAAVGGMRLLWGYFDPMTASYSGHTPVELLKLSKEAVLGFRDFIDTKASSTGSSVVGISESEQLWDHNLVTAVVDILLYDPGTSTWAAGAVQPSIIKILLWVWKNTSKVSMSSQETRKIFFSSCRLWAPLEKHVEFSRTGKVGRYDADGKPLTPEDLKRINEFIDYVRKYQNHSAFISRNADVGINRLHAHLDQRVDWEYELFDFYEPRSNLGYWLVYIEGAGKARKRERSATIKV